MFLSGWRRGRFLGQDPTDQWFSQAEDLLRAGRDIQTIARGGTVTSAAVPVAKFQWEGMMPVIIGVGALGALYLITRKK